MLRGIPAGTYINSGRFTKAPVGMLVSSLPKRKSTLLTTTVIQNTCIRLCTSHARPHCSHSCARRHIMSKESGMMYDVNIILYAHSAVIFTLQHTGVSMIETHTHNVPSLQYTMRGVVADTHSNFRRFTKSPAAILVSLMLDRYRFLCANTMFKTLAFVCVRLTLVHNTLITVPVVTLCPNMCNLYTLAGIIRT